MTTLAPPPLNDTAPRPRLKRNAAWLKAIAAPILAVAFGLGAWEVASIASDGWVPPLADLLAATGSVFSSDTLLADLATTLRRVLLVWAGSVVVGLLLGVAAGFSWQLRAFLRPVLAVALAVPDVVYIIIVILVLGTAESSGILAVILAIAPLVINVTMASVLARDVRLDEMAAAYKFGPLTYMRHVLWYQLRPAAEAAARTSFAFSWKLIVLLEAITSPNGIGARIMQEFKYLRPAEMIVYALLFTALMKAIEVLVVDRFLRTRHEPAT
ncbi:ABC transporter permease [Mycolicibacterium sp. jd]|uniref:ABC transporter permease n=1 Tax=unclassified Mycolicibacterium TaxID=2636767 RepID=UPI00351BAB92